MEVTQVVTRRCAISRSGEKKAHERADDHHEQSLIPPPDVVRSFRAVHIRRQIGTGHQPCVADRQALRAADVIALRRSGGDFSWSRGGRSNQRSAVISVFYTVRMTCIGSFKGRAGFRRRLARHTCSREVCAGQASVHRH